MENKKLALSLLIIVLISTASGEDLLKPLIDDFFNAMKSLVDVIAGFVFGLFPGLEESFAGDPLGPIAGFFPWIRSLYWLFYLAVFFAVMAVIAKLWGMGKHFMINTIVGILLLLILIHVLGVGIQITILALIITAVFGIPGVIFIVMLHYLGIPL